MSQWLHALCDDCFDIERPGVTPVRVLEAEPEICCACGEKTAEPVYYRDDPAKYEHCTHDGGKH